MEKREESDKGGGGGNRAELQRKQKRVSSENGIEKNMQASIAAPRNAYRVLGNIRRAVIGLRFS